MSKRFHLVAALGALSLLGAAGAADAQSTASSHDDNPTAYGALRLISKTLGREALDRVVEVTGHDGVPQPYLWKVVLKEGIGSREIDVTGGKIGSQRELSRPPTATLPIHFADLNLDSSGAFDATDTQARKIKLRYDSLDYALSVNPATGKPVWHIDLINKEGSQIGTIRLAAHDGTVLSTTGQLANNAPPASTPPPVAHHSTPEPTPPPIARRSTPEPTPRPVRETATVAATTTTVRRSAPPPVHHETTTVTTTTASQDIPVERLSDRGDVETVPTPQPPPEEEGGLFTRMGRTLDHSSHAVKHRVLKDGATVQRFFTGHTEIDPDGSSARPGPAE